MNGVSAPTAGRVGAFRPPSPTLVIYVLRELAAPTLMGFGLFTFFMLMNTLLQLAEMIIRDRLGAGDVGLLFLYSVPHIIVLTVPMAVLVGGIIAFGRLSADSEIIALRSSGVSVYQLALPILLIGFLAFLFNLYLCLEILPWGNNAIRQHQWRLINSRTLTNQVRPRVFETRFPNFTLYVEEVTQPEQEWDRLLLVRTDRNPPQVVMAQSAFATYSNANREAWIELTDGVIYEGGATAEESSVTSFAQQRQLLDSQAGSAVGPISKDERTMNLRELRAEIAERAAASQPIAKYAVEVHKKFAIPVAGLVMALIALPLGVSTTQRTKATGYLMAIGVIAVYYVFIDGGEKFAEEEAIPAWLGVWAADIVITVAALFLLWAKATEKDFGILDRLLGAAEGARNRVLNTWYAWRGEAGFSSSGDDGRRPGSAVSGRRFPRILDLYVLSQFARVGVLTISGLMVIWMIGEYFEISDDVYQAGASRWIYLEYFQFQLPFIFVMTLPIRFASLTPRFANGRSRSLANPTPQSDLAWRMIRSSGTAASFRRRR